MSDNGSSHLGPDEAMKREQAERLLADIYDVVVLLVSAYAAKVLLKTIDPYSPYPLPPEVIADHLGELGVVHDTVMAWTTEALEREGVPQPRRPAGEVGRVFSFERLIKLGDKDFQVQSGLNSARMSVEAAALQLAITSPDDRAGQETARRLLGEAITRLIGASARLMKFDDDEWTRLHRMERIHIEADPPVHPQSTAAPRFRPRLDEAEKGLKATADKATRRPEGSAAAEAHYLLHPKEPNHNLRRADFRPERATGGRRADRFRAPGAAHGRTPPGASPARPSSRFGTRW